MDMFKNINHGVGVLHEPAIGMHDLHSLHFEDGKGDKRNRQVRLFVEDIRAEDYVVAANHDGAICFGRVTQTTHLGTIAIQWSDGIGGNRTGIEVLPWLAAEKLMARQSTSVAECRDQISPEIGAKLRKQVLETTA